MRSALSLRVVVGLRVELANAEQIHHLLVHLLLAVDDAAYDLFLVGADGRHVDVEAHLWLSCYASDVHEAVDTYGVVREAVADV